jgi:signal transduction histidine kinase
MASIVVGLVLTVSAVGLVRLERRQLSNNLDTTLSQRAETIAASFGAADVSPVIANSDAEDQAAQLVADIDGVAVVVAATANLAGAPAVAPGLPRGHSQRFDDVADLPLPESTYRVLTRRVGTSSGPATLHVLESTDDLDDTVGGLIGRLALSLPVVLVLLVTLMWWLVGRALRPVDEIRQEVADISGTDLDRRVHVPERDDEIARLAATMNGMLDRISGVAERERRFVADASHELRTPLTRIRTAVEVDAADPDGADWLATNRLVHDEADALQQLVEDLLYLARSDAGALVLTAVPVDLDDIVLDEVRRQRTQTARRIDISDVSAGHVAGDPAQLARVVRNLLSNAVRHATATVAISLAELDGTVELVIDDDGPGVPADLREVIFERFARADDDRGDASGGTGLGLAITRDIVERHGGRIQLDGTRTSGARFVVTLPATDR